MRRKQLTKTSFGWWRIAICYKLTESSHRSWRTRSTQFYIYAINTRSQFHNCFHLFISAKRSLVSPFDLFICVNQPSNSKYTLYFTLCTLQHYAYDLDDQQILLYIQQFSWRNNQIAIIPEINAFQLLINRQQAQKRIINGEYGI